MVEDIEGLPIGAQDSDRGEPVNALDADGGRAW